ncbi:SWIM zinc finger family protein [Paenibacillus kobensis]|uniref:SWIM zinc finger family protein n=1 Tax=Paenibacillus kobensis TaxID=59841 RepID=UPI000FD74299|nr:SWIM zinc finger family protein [Paenibacillus kobensis]
MSSLSPTIDDNSWQQLLAQAASLYNDVTLSRGFQYYKQGRVRSYTPLNDQLIMAVVAGSDHYNVKLNADKLSASRCECPVGSNCKHIVAVLLQYAQRGGRPAAAVINAKLAGAASSASTVSSASTAERSSASPSVSSVSTPSTTQPASAAAAPNRHEQLMLQAKRLPELPMKEWRELFEQCTQSLTDTRSLSNGQSILAPIKRVKPPLSEELDALYELYARLFALEKLLAGTQQQWQALGYFYSFQSQEALSALTREISDLLGSRTPFTASSGTEQEAGIRQRLADITDDVRRQMLMEHGMLRSFLNVYMLLWSTWLKPARREAEPYTAELEKLLAAQPLTGDARSRLPIQLASSWMHFYLSQDEQAWDILREANRGNAILPSDLTDFLRALPSEQDWSRMEQWLVEIGDLLSVHRTLELPAYIAGWYKLVEHRPEAEPVMWQTLIGMMPASKHIYEEALLTYGKWRQWIDYQMSTGVEPLSHRVTELAPIEKHAPEALLPYYHQAVERYVLAKNRDGYKSAVKLLKRLAKLYKKLKQEPRWALFLTAFADRHSRLRALQEELRKGNLVE